MDINPPNQPNQPTDPVRPRPIDITRPMQRPLHRSEQRITPVADTASSAEPALPQKAADTTPLAATELEAPTPTATSYPLRTADPVPPQPEKKSARPRGKRRSALTFFVVLAVSIFITVLAVVPGIVVKSFATGFGSIGATELSAGSVTCFSNNLKSLPTTTVYSNRHGLPLTYTSKSVSTIHALCDGQSRSASGGQAGFFNVVPLVVDVLVAFLIAFVAAKSIRKYLARVR